MKDEGGDEWQTPSVTFNDPKYSLQALAQAESEAQAELEGDSDDDGHEQHDEWNETIFKSKDMPNHSPEAVKLDLALIKKHTTVQGHGNICQPDDYATIHWTARVKGSNEIVEDSRKKYGEKNPKIFVLGHFDKVKCFDLIVP